ncbi:PhzF family phenazine biosynthesis protein [Clostridium sp. UBA6640]|uniref:PhzF family phenazine biosynthesis protein n=1 Tax=Clostridium sp. UBA6640 TaxID=1946370 RepID=UPI0025C654D2|nr:PhzF family phenazine biosynthesis protein [Clostridium sp. UBA6640]
MGLSVYIVNAFTKDTKGGNGAGVVVDASMLTASEMQIIAKEVGLSETAFIIPNANKKKHNNSKNVEDYDFEVRFFTPTQEVELCGHATIASFYTLANLGMISCDGGKNQKIIRQKTKAGILDVELNFSDDNISNVLMTQTDPNFLFEIDDSSELCNILGISSEDIFIESFKIKPQAVSTGLADIMLPVKNLKVLKSINPDFKKLADYSNSLGVIGVHAFTLETENDTSNVSTRNFGPAAGIDEESATGTSNGALGAYLIKNEIIKVNKDESTTIYCEQGYYMDNPSEIIVKGEKSFEKIVIKVGGKASIIAKKEIELNEI